MEDVSNLKNLNRPTFEVFDCGPHLLLLLLTLSKFYHWGEKVFNSPPYNLLVPLLMYT